MNNIALAVEKLARCLARISRLAEMTELQT